MKTIDRAELERLIGVVEGKLAKLLKDTTGDTHAIFHSRADEALEELVKEEGARSGGSLWDVDRLSLGGIKSTCTYGAHGVMCNWLTAARRKLEAMP